MQYKAYSDIVLHYVLAKKSLTFLCVVLETALSSTCCRNFVTEFFHIGTLLLLLDILSQCLITCWERIPSDRQCSCSKQFLLSGTKDEYSMFSKVKGDEVICL